MRVERAPLPGERVQVVRAAFDQVAHVDDQLRTQQVELPHRDLEDTVALSAGQVRKNGEGELARIRIR